MTEASGTTRLHEFRTLQRTSKVERVDEDGAGVRYKSVMLLAPGEWTDAASRTTIFYAPDAIKRSAANWVDTQVNLYHKPGDPIANVGHVDASSVTTDDRGRLYADIVLHGRTTASEDAIGLMDLALESDGEHGLGGPSVEIPEDRTEWDSERGMERMQEMTFSGVGLVMHPASQTVAFDQQFEERAVAMAAGGERQSVAIMTTDAERGGTTKTRGTERTGMGADDTEDDTEPTAGGDDTEDAFAQLEATRDRLRTLAKQLQNPTDELLAAISTYLTVEDTSPDDPVEEFMAWAEENVSDDALGAAQSFLESDGDGSTVGEMQDWAEGATDEPDESDESDESGAPDEDVDEEMQDDEDVGEEMPGDGGGSGGGALPDETARAVASALNDTVDTLEQVQSAVEDEIDSAGAEMQEELANLKERLSALEENGSGKSLADGEDADSDGDNLDAVADVPRPERGYISR